MLYIFLVAELKQDYTTRRDTPTQEAQSLDLH